MPRWNVTIKLQQLLTDCEYLQMPQNQNHIKVELMYVHNNIVLY